MQCLTEKEDKTQNNAEKNIAISMHNFYGYWSTENNHENLNASIKNANLVFEKGLIYGIYGEVGAGKSTLLAALLSELPAYSGFLHVYGNLTYVEQHPVIF